MYNAKEAIGVNTAFDEEREIRIGDAVQWKGLDSYHKGTLKEIQGETALIETEKGTVRIPEGLITKVIVPVPLKKKETENLTDTVPWEPDNGLIINI